MGNMTVLVPLSLSASYVVLTRPNKAKTAVHGC